LLVFLEIVLGAIASSVLLYLLIPSLNRRLLDQPNDRSSHLHPTPRGGGVSFLFVGTAACALSWCFNSTSSPVSLHIIGVPLLAFPLAVVGFLDDRYNLSPLFRYGIQLLTAALLVLISPIKPLYLLLPILLFAVTAVINFTNFMDGLDGLVAGCMTIIISALSLVLCAPWPLWVLVGSLVGFLRWNWSPAKVFMGDVGSTFLGAVFAGLLLQSQSWPGALGALLVATPLLADACFCVLRRLLAGQRVFQPHRLHLFQRLHQAGWSHARVSLTYIAATAVLAVAMLAGGWPWVFGLAVVVLLVGMWLDQRLAVPFAVASQS